MPVLYPARGRRVNSLRAGAAEAAALPATVRPALETDHTQAADAAGARHLMLPRPELAQEGVRARGKFANDAARDKVLAIYEEASRELAKRVSQRGK